MMFVYLNPVNLYKSFDNLTRFCYFVHITNHEMTLNQRSYIKTYLQFKDHRWWETCTCIITYYVL